MKIRAYSVGDRGEISGGWCEGNGTKIVKLNDVLPYLGTTKIEDGDLVIVEPAKLMIPKNIAEILDSVFNRYTELQNNANSLMIQTIFVHYNLEDPFYKWFNRENNSYNISIIYMASKAIGGEIIKVIEE